MLSAKVAHVLAWTQQKVKRATVASGGSTIADAFGAAFPVPLGRVDATSSDEPVKIPTQSASPTEVKVRQGERSNASRTLQLKGVLSVYITTAQWLLVPVMQTLGNMCHTLLHI